MIVFVYFAVDKWDPSNVWCVLSKRSESDGKGAPDSHRLNSVSLLEITGLFFLSFCFQKSLCNMEVQQKDSQKGEI